MIKSKPQSLAVKIFWIVTANPNLIKIKRYRFCDWHWPWFDVLDASCINAIVVMPNPSYILKMMVKLIMLHRSIRPGDVSCPDSRPDAWWPRVVRHRWIITRKRQLGQITGQKLSQIWTEETCPNKSLEIVVDLVSAIQKTWWFLSILAWI